MGVILTASSDGVETGLQNQELRINEEPASSLYPCRHGLFFLQTRLQIWTSRHRLDDDGKRLRGVSDIGEPELGELDNVDARWLGTYTFDFNRFSTTERNPQ